MAVASEQQRVSRSASTAIYTDTRMHKIYATGIDTRKIVLTNSRESPGLHTYTHTYIHTHMHTYMHTHTESVGMSKVNTQTVALIMWLTRKMQNSPYQG
jgi:hypothetical protein